LFDTRSVIKSSEAKNDPSNKEELSKKPTGSFKKDYSRNREKSPIIGKTNIAQSFTKRQRLATINGDASIGNSNNDVQSAAKQRLS
jgi:hypothetical protein